MLPNMKPLTAESLVPHGCYLLDNGDTITMWVGQDASAEFLAAVFNVGSLQEIAWEGAEEEVFAPNGSDVRASVI